MNLQRIALSADFGLEVCNLEDAMATVPERGNAEGSHAGLSRPPRALALNHGNSCGSALTLWGLFRNIKQNFGRRLKQNKRSDICDEESTDEESVFDL